jgi:spore coat polysaccharide biosynthesis protein SpsF
MALKKVCIVQARLGSRRLPGKVIKIINKKPMIYWLILRLNKAKIFDLIVIAIPRFGNSKLFNYLKSIENETGIKIYRGSENNVLERYYCAAKIFKAGIITRVTADDPLKDINVMRSSLSLFTKLKLDYYSNSIKQTFPIGIDIEHFTFKTLKLARKLAVTNYEKEHVTSAIKKRPDIFKIKNFTNSLNLTKYRLTVDNANDFKRIKKIFTFYKENPYINYKKIIKFLDKQNEKNH